MAENMDIDAAPVKRRGRGFQQTGDEEDVLANNKVVSYDSVDMTDEVVGGRAARSIEGWIVLVTGVHEEATEEDIQDMFSEWGDIKNMHLNLDRRSGYVKGYALVEYENRDQAARAIAGASGAQLLEKTLTCDFAFVKPPAGANPTSKGDNRRRSNSPGW